MTEAAYIEFFLNSPSSVVQLELLEISHPNFTQTYRCVRNATLGVTVTLEDTTEATFAYVPMRVSALNAGDDLDQSIRVELGDLGEIIPVELDAVAAADGYGTKPTVLYRAYRSDDLTAPIIGPFTLEVSNFAFTREGAVFDAKAPNLNAIKTGERYTLDRFPMLRGFL